jgi:hypothetical protein
MFGMTQRSALVAMAALAFSLLVACDRTAAHEPESHASAPEPTAAPPTAHLSDKLARPAPARLVAIGDFHGDLDHARRALRLAGAIDAKDAWVGGKLVVVQTGDEIDRGDDDRAILDLVEKLKGDAAKAGGAVVALLGNHEIMNASLDFRYVTPGGFAAFSLFTPADGGALPSKLDAEARGRAAAFEPGGIYARMLSARPIVAKVGESVFVHGGVLPKHVAYGLDTMNDEVSAWLTGKRASPPSVVVAEDGPVWTRLYSEDETAPGCATLSAALAAMGATRMVVGHTVQRGGVTSACEGRVWRIDVGLAHYFGGPIEALEIVGDKVNVLREAR